MDKVQMKATEIRDKIMDWLGFTKILNPLTGEISWKLREGQTRLKTILDILKVAVATILGIKILGKLRNLITLLRTGQATGLKPFQSGIVGIVNALKSTGTWFKIGIDNFKSLRKAGEGIGSALTKTAKGMFDLIPTALKATVGIAGLTASLYAGYDAMKKFGEGTKSAKDAYIQFGISIAGAAASGALIGSIFGPAGAAIGAVTGALADVVIGLTAYKIASDETKISLKEQRAEWEKQREEISKSVEEWDNMVEAVQNSLNGNLVEIENTKRLTNELEALIDVNGRVKAGYEDRVQYILNTLNSTLGTEYELTGNQISRNGELVDSYDEIKDEIYKVIEAKKAQAIYEANLSIYTEAIKNQQKYYNDMEQAQENLNKSWENLQGFLNYYTDDNNVNSVIASYLDKVNLSVNDIRLNTEKWQDALIFIETTDYRLAKQLREEAEAHRNDINTNIETYDKAAKRYKRANEFIIAQDNLGTAILTGNQEEVNKEIENTMSIYEDETVSFKQRINNQIAYSNQLKEEIMRDNHEITQSDIERAEAGVKAAADNLKAQTVLVNGELGQNVIEGWKALATGSKEVYNNAIKDLPEDVKIKVQEATGNIVTELNNSTPAVENASKNISDAITKNLDGTMSINMGLNIDYSELKKKLQKSKAVIDMMASNPLLGSTFQKYSNNLQTLINQLSGYATGGFPEIGEIFIAREAGPELVGSIGNRNAVMNNQQIVDAVSSGVARAVASVLGNGGSSYQLIIDGEQITNVVQKRLTRQANITGMAMGV
jgi:hypothetical protein